MLTETDRPYNVHPEGSPDAGRGPGDPRDRLRFGRARGLPGLAALLIAEPTSATATLETIFGPGGPAPTVSFECEAGTALIYQVEGFHFPPREYAIDEVLPADPGDVRLSGLRVLLGAQEDLWTIGVEPPSLPAPPGLAKRLCSGDDADVALLPAALHHHLIAHHARPVRVAAPAMGPAAPRRSKPQREVGDPGPIPRDELLGLAPLEKVEYALERIGIGARRADSGGLVARCPLHFGDRENFSAREADDGRAIIYCHRCECEVEALTESLGLRVSDLFPARDFRPGARVGRRPSGLGMRPFGDGAAKVTDEMADAWREEADRYAMTWRSQRDGPDPALLSARRLGLPVDYYYDWMGRPAIGRPGSRAAILEVARLLRDDPRDVVVLGENDRTAGGDWPGDPGPCASGLARLLPGRSIKTLLPPEGCKDIREFVVMTMRPLEAGA